MTTVIQFQMSFPVDDDLAPLLQDLFFNGVMPDTCTTTLSQEGTCEYCFHDLPRDTLYRLRMYPDTGAYVIHAVYSIHVPYAEDATLTVWPTTPPAQWTVHPNLPAFYQHAKYLVMSSTQEVTEVMTSHSSTSDDCVQLRAEDIVG